MRAFRATFLGLVALAAAAREPATWIVSRTAHFEVYSNAGEDAARSLVGGLERLHAFFATQLGAAPRGGPVRVVCFATAQEFAQYRTQAGVGAFYLVGPGGDYIVMPAGARGDLRDPGHEYAHLLLHSRGWKLPPWMAEGISEVASTVRIDDRESRAGGDLPDRVRALKNNRWIPLVELFSRGESPDPLFYAQSWAVADLLLFSPKYASGFPAFLSSLAAHVSAEQALSVVYHTTVDAVDADLRARFTRPHFSVPIGGSPGPAPVIQSTPLDSFQARAMLAELQFVSGDLDRSEALYRALAAERSGDAKTQGALGTIAFQRGDTASAAALWKKAIALGIADAGLCYRYGILSEDRAALERALVLDPGLDDVRFKLALMEKNVGHAQEAVAQLRAMKEVAPMRAFAYWSALADALLDLNHREEARQSAARAAAAATSDAERKRAADLDWMAATELAVEFDGKQARTVRVPVDGPPRNPFIERSDLARSAEGELEEVECSDDALRVKVRTADGELSLGVPDLTRVQIRNGGGVKFELTCGVQQGRRVLVEYTASGVLRGLELR